MPYRGNSIEGSNPSLSAIFRTLRNSRTHFSYRLDSPVAAVQRTNGGLRYCPSTATGTGIMGKADNVCYAPFPTGGPDPGTIEVPGRGGTVTMVHGLRIQLEDET